MKVYLISHTGAPAPWKMRSWVDTEKVGTNGVYVASVRAFLKKKEAKKWLKETGWTHLEIKTAEIL
jgi:hypothetical protein